MNNMIEQITDNTVQLAVEIRQLLNLPKSSKESGSLDYPPALNYIIDISEGLLEYLSGKDPIETEPFLEILLKNIATLRHSLEAEARGNSISLSEKIALSNLASTSLFLLKSIRTRE